MKRFLAVSALLILGVTANAQSSSGPEGDEGLKTLTMRYQIAFPANSTITGTYQTVDGTATAADNDYIPTQGQFVIDVGQTQSTPIQVQIVGDRKIEANESFTLVASQVAGGAAPPPLTLTINNDDLPVVTVGGASVTEGNAGTTAMTFPVTLTTSAAIPVQASYVAQSGTAISGEDFQPAEGTITFAPGASAQNVIVNIIGDMSFEPAETFTLVVTPAGGQPVQATGTINNDDTLAATRVTIISGNNQQGRLGHALEQPLVVQALNPNNAGVAGVNVQWSVTRGDAQLSASSTVTGADGRTSISVASLRSVGPIDVTATAANLAPVIFTINAQTSFESRARGPVAVPIARVLDRVCARNEQTFTVACRTLSLLSDGDLTPALERVAPQQSGAQSKVAGEVVAAVTTGVSARLSALRGGVDRVSVQQLALNVNGQMIPLGTILHSLFPQDAQTDAGGEESDYNGWSAFLSGNLGDGERIARDGTLGFDLDSQGLMFGVDRMVGQGIVGASLNLMQLDAELSDDFGKLDTSGYALSLYASRGGFFASSSPNASFDGMHLDGSVTIGRNTYESEHVVEIGGFTLLDATSENDASVFAVSGGTGFELHRGRTDFDFSLSGTWSRAEIDDLTEEGSGPLILFVQGHEIESLTGTIGFNLRSAFAVPFGTLLPSFRAEMVHEFEDGARFVTARFQRAPDSSFTIPLDQPDSNYGRVGAGLQGVFPYGWSVSIEAMQDVSRSDLHFRNVQFTVYKSF